MEKNLLARQTFPTFLLSIYVEELESVLSASIIIQISLIKVVDAQHLFTSRQGILQFILSALLIVAGGKPRSVISHVCSVLIIELTCDEDEPREITLGRNKFVKWCEVAIKVYVANIHGKCNKQTMLIVIMQRRIINPDVQRPSNILGNSLDPFKNFWFSLQQIFFCRTSSR